MRLRLLAVSVVLIGATSCLCGPEPLIFPDAGGSATAVRSWLTAAPLQTPEASKTRAHLMPVPLMAEWTLARAMLAEPMQARVMPVPLTLELKMVGVMPAS